MDCANITVFFVRDTPRIDFISDHSILLFSFVYVIVLINVILVPVPLMGFDQKKTNKQNKTRNKQKNDRFENEIKSKLEQSSSLPNKQANLIFTSQTFFSFLHCYCSLLQGLLLLIFAVVVAQYTVDVV